MKWYVDGAGWNGTRSRYALANDQREFPIIEFKREFTNNEMEYVGMLRALYEAEEGDEICSDSQLVVNQVKGAWKVREKRLRPYCEQAKELKAKKNITIKWIPRSRNKAGKMLE